MEQDLKTIVDLLQKTEPGEDWLDIVSALSVPILSFTAFIVTTIISIKQWLLMKYEYRLKLYPERFDLYKGLIDLLYELQQEGKFTVDKYKIPILKIENKMFIFDKNINDKYQEIKDSINSVDATSLDFDRTKYTNWFLAELSILIDAIKKYLQNKHIDIA